MALALELSRREGKSNPPPPEPSLHNRTALEPDRHRPATQPGSTHRSFSSAPFFNYGTGSEEEDEDLQMALACSLSEMEAQQRAASTDLIAGALGGGGAKRYKAAVHKQSRVVEVTQENVGGEEKVMNVGPEGTIGGEVEKEELRNANGESGSSPDLRPNFSSEPKFDSVVQSGDGRAKKKKKCGCSVC